MPLRERSLPSGMKMSVFRERVMRREKWLVRLAVAFTSISVVITSSVSVKLYDLILILAIASAPTIDGVTSISIVVTFSSLSMRPSLFESFPDSTNIFYHEALPSVANSETTRSLTDFMAD